MQRKQSFKSILPSTVAIKSSIMASEGDAEFQRHRHSISRPQQINHIDISDISGIGISIISNIDGRSAHSNDDRYFNASAIASSTHQAITITTITITKNKTPNQNGQSKRPIKTSATYDTCLRIVSTAISNQYLPRGTLVHTRSFQSVLNSLVSEGV